MCVREGCVHDLSVGNSEKKFMNSDAGKQISLAE
jgi:hypothetical protein